MNIKTRLAFQFTLFVGVILVLFAITIYLLSSGFREREFYNRLEKKAMTSALLLLKVNEVDSTLLTIIDKNTIHSLNEEIVSIYTTDAKLVYQSPGDTMQTPGQNLFQEVLIHKNLQYKQENRECVAFLYIEKGKKYIVFASAYDIYGLRELSNLRIVLIIGLAISILLTLFISRTFAGNAISPLSRLVKQADNITASRLDLRLDEENGKDEIAQLAITFNHMLQRLESAFEMQRNFVSNASHEMRTPLTAITGQLEVALLKERNRDEYEAIIHSVLDDIQNFNTLTNGMLELAQASIDRSSLTIKPVRMDEVLLQAQKDVLRRNPSYKIKIQFEQLPDDDSLLTISGSENLMKIAMINLMENGCKFSSDSTAIINISFDYNHLQLEIIDNGIGIPVDEQNQIFEPFYRATNTKDQKGHGIGLSLVHRIIQLHQAQISLQSELHKGTRIKIIF
jgi:signal transduction histidine kinase